MKFNRTEKEVEWTEKQIISQTAKNYVGTMFMTLKKMT